MDDHVSRIRALLQGSVTVLRGFGLMGAVGTVEEGKKGGGEGEFKGARGVCGVHWAREKTVYPREGIERAGCCG